MKIFNRENRIDQTPSGGAAAVQTGLNQGVTQAGKYGLAFGSVYVFTLLLYLRPNELFPEIFGTLSIIKFVAITAVLSYAFGKLSSGEPLSVWVIEVKMMLLMAALCLLLMPVAAAPHESWEVFNDTFSKVVLIFILMVNLLDTRKRLISIINLVLAGGVWIALGAIKGYLGGGPMLLAKGVPGRIAFEGGGMFGNPNDLADALDLLIPLAIALGLFRTGILRWIYFAVAGLFCVVVMITYSRGGFLGMAAVLIFMMWKLGRGRRVKMLFAAILIFGFVAVAAPGGFGKRVFTIFDSEQDQTGSSYQRRLLLERVIRVAIARPYGVGMGNYHIYSVNEEKAHNGYLEIAAELGILGLIAYLIINFKPLFRLRAMERQLGDSPQGKDRETYYLCVGLQAILVGYVVCSFFASIEYLWYLYYPAAYAIGLCRIYELEKVADSSNLALVQVSPAGAKSAGGVLWKPKLGEGVLWENSRNLSRETNKKEAKLLGQAKVQ